MKIGEMTPFFAAKVQSYKNIDRASVRCEKNSNELRDLAYKNKVAVSFGALANSAKMVEKLEQRLQKEGSDNDIIKDLSKNLAYCIDSIAIAELNFRQIVQKYGERGITKETYLQCIKKHPRLMHVTLRGLEKHFDEVLKKYSEHGVTIEDYIKSCLKIPLLFEVQPFFMRLDKTFFATSQHWASPQAAKVESPFDSKAREVSQKYFEGSHITIEGFKKCAHRQDTLKTLPSDIILKRLEKNSTLLKKNGLAKKDFIKCVTKQPSLIYTQPETLSTKLDEAIKVFEKFNITREEYVKMAKGAPSILYQSPKTLLKNVEGVAEAFKDYNLSEAQYFSCVKKQPTLFGLSAKTVESNIREVVETFKDDGLTIEQYLKIARTQPALFYYSAKNIESKVNEIAQAFEKEGLKRGDIIRACNTNTIILALAPKTLINRIKIRDFITKDRQKGLGQEVDDL